MKYFQYLFFCIFVLLCTLVGTNFVYSHFLNVGGIPLGTSTVLTTYTIQETDGVSQASGWWFTRGMAFPRGAVTASQHVLCRQAVTHVDLGCEWNEISHRVENGDDGSLRHGVFTV